MPKLLPNLPIENLTYENDYLGIIQKGELITNFLKSNTAEFAEIKMFSIFGEWGSGKSTLLKYLQKDLKPSFNTFFFESWEFESDSNLSLSLLEFLIKESDGSTERACKELLKTGEKLFKGFTKSVNISFPGVSFDSSKLLEIFENSDKTFFQSREKFKIEFVRWEDNITRGERPDFNIVFVDDLDRCEPENVLNLLSAIKLFFTYGKKTIFFCGIDKKAISEAVRTKYGEVVKANEYLEKVFDISFSMPIYSNIKRMINYYFVGQKVIYLRKEKELATLINDFFVDLHFTNPRRVKKVLNKYLIIKNIVINNKTQSILPNILIEDEGSLFEIYLTLFLIILYEFEPENYKNLFNLSLKRSAFTEAIKKSKIIQNELNDLINNMNGLLTDDLINISFREVSQKIHNPRGSKFFDRVVALFIPNNIDTIHTLNLKNTETYTRYLSFYKKSYEYYYTLFLIQNEELFYQFCENSILSFQDYKKMIVDLM